MGVLCVPSLSDPDRPLFVSLANGRQLEAVYEFRRKLKKQ